MQFTQIVECYSCIFLQQYDAFFATESNKEKNLIEQLRQLKAQREGLEVREKDLKGKENAIRSLLAGKNDEIDRLKKNEDDLLKQVNHLNELVDHMRKDRDRKGQVRLEHMNKVVDLVRGHADPSDNAAAAALAASIDSAEDFKEGLSGEKYQEMLERIVKKKRKIERDA